jgi:hypothetical protein
MSVECIKSGKKGWRMSGECIESGEKGWRMSGECIESGQNGGNGHFGEYSNSPNWRIFGEYSNSTNSPASGHCLEKRLVNLILCLHQMKLGLADKLLSRLTFYS